MTDTSLTRKIIADRELYLFCILFFVLPVSPNATSWCMWGIVASWIIDPNILSKIKTAFSNRYVLLYLSPVFLMVVTLTYTDNLDAGIKSIGNKAFLLLFPVVLSTFEYTGKKINTLFQSFALSIALWAFVCTSIGVYNFFTVEATFENMSGDYHNRVVSPWNFLTNIHLVEPISISPIYMSMLTGIAIIILAHIIKTEGKARMKWLWIVVTVLLFVFNILLGSRMGLISLIIALPFFYVFNFGGLFRKYTLRIALIGTVAICFIFALFLFNPILQKRFGKDLMNTAYPSEASGWNSVNIRSAVWYCSFQAAKQKIVFGYGLGSEHQAREACYKNFSFYGPMGTDLNSHNQYLEYLLIGGLVLLTALMISLGTSTYYACYFRTSILLAFVIFIALNFLTESLLAVQKGIIIYSLFNSLFTFGSAAIAENRRVSL